MYKNIRAFGAIIEWKSGKFAPNNSRSMGVLSSFRLIRSFSLASKMCLPHSHSTTHVSPFKCTEMHLLDEWCANFPMMRSTIVLQMATHLNIIHL